MVNDFLTEKEMLLLPNSLRKELSTPIGKLYTFHDHLPPEQQIFEMLSKYTGLVVSVGDVVTDSLFLVNFFPNFAFIDNKTLRGEYSSSYLSNLKILNIKNEPATISFEAWELIHNLYKSFKENNNSIKLDSSPHSNKNNTTLVMVSGEEDLLVIPCIMEAPIGSLIMYGQPKEGIVLITVDESIKESIEKLLTKFEKKTSVQS